MFVSPLASAQPLTLLQTLQAVVLCALASRNLPDTIEGVQADPRVSVLALPGELLDPQLSAVPQSAITAAHQLGNEHLTPRGLGELYEILAESGRSSSGRFYTPVSVTVELTARALRGAAVASTADSLQRTICDPAMGCGFFLLAALALTPPEHYSIQVRYLYGVEQDPIAAMVARAAIGLAMLDVGEFVPDLRAQLIAGDALRADQWPVLFPEVFSAGGFDIVVGNPPYIDSERMMRDMPLVRKQVAQAWPTARGNWDLFVPFVELALRLLRPGGCCALIVPNRLLGADYARTLRTFLAEHVIEALLDYSAADVFAASVYPLALVVRRKTDADTHTTHAQHQIDVRVFATGREQHPQVVHVAQVATATLARLGDTWWPIFSPVIGLVEQCLRYTVPLAELASARESATVAEAYAIVGLIVDLPMNQLPDGYLKLVNTGTLDRYTIRWGKRPLRYLGQRYLRPVIEIAQLGAVHARLLPGGQRRIVMAGLGQRLEGYLDLEGTLLPAKTTVILTATHTDAWALLGLLNSQTATWLYRQLHGGLALRGGYLRIGARQLARFPVPKTLPAILGQLAQMRAAMPTESEETNGIDQQIDTIVAGLYGITHVEDLT